VYILTGKLLNRAGEALGLAYLPRDYLSFLKASLMFAFGQTICNTFVNTFLFQTGGGFTAVIRYNLLLYVFQILSYSTVAALSGRVKPTSFTRLGIVMFACAAVTLLVLGERSGAYYPLIAVFVGIGGGAYWLPYYIFSVSFTTPANHQYALSANGMISTVIYSASPALSGFIISRLPGLTGYMTVFAVAIAAFLCAVVMSFKIPSDLSRENPLPGLFRRYKRDRALWSFIAGEILHGVRDGAFMFYLTTLLFAMVTSELAVGLTMTARSIMSIIVYKSLIAGSAPRERMLPVIAVTAAGLIFTGGLHIWFTVAAIVTYSIFNAVMQSFVQNGVQYTTFELCGYFSRDGTPRAYGVTAVRSIALDIGRVAGISFMLLFPPGLDSAVTILFILSLAGFPMVFFYRYCSRLCSLSNMTDSDVLSDG